MWGQGITRKAVTTTVRIIPTRVGTRYLLNAHHNYNQDHPHACGDKTFWGMSSERRRGSSPRVWGQAKKVYPKEGELRIIPTRVGTSNKLSNYIWSGEDHPHACGDKWNVNPIRHLTLGSSPRVWGQDTVFATRVIFQRIIPTRVGTRFIRFYRLSMMIDHPHACGDKISNNRCFVSSTGSSPRVWGQVPASIGARINCRIIPTRVGTRLTH